MADSKEMPSGNRKFVHPWMIAVNLLMAGVVVLFAALAYGYIFYMGRDWMEFKLPKIFWLSTVCILMVSFFLNRTLRFYDLDRPKALRLSLLSALLFGCIFIVCQVEGWSALYAEGKTLTTSTSLSYLYLLTGLHAVHVLAGIAFLVVAVFRGYRNTASEVKMLLFFSDPMKKARLKLLNTYWHTVDFLWVFIFLAFLFRLA